MRRSAGKPYIIMYLSALDFCQARFTFSKEATVIKIIPISLKTANEFVIRNHRYHGKVQGCKFCIGVVDGQGKLRGVAVTGRPVSRHLDDGKTAEVTRLCTDGMKNACSFLYCACSKIAKNMGYEKIISYILADEKGTSLRASNWQYGGQCSALNRKNSAYSSKKGKKVMYFKNL